MGTVQNQNDRTIAQSKPRKKMVLLRLCCSLALSVLLSHGGIDPSLGGFMHVANALPAPGPTLPIQQAALVVTSLGETNFTAAGAQEKDNITPSRIFRVLLEHSTSKTNSNGRNHKDNNNNASKRTPMNQNGDSGQDQQHRDFLSLASRVSGQSPDQIDQELQEERQRVQKEHQLHFQSLRREQKQEREQLLRKQRQQQRLEDDEDDDGDDEGHGRGKKQQRHRVHGKGAGRIRLPTDVTYLSKGKAKIKKLHGHGTGHDHRREKANNHDEDDDYVDEDEDDDTESFARRPQWHHHKDKKTKSKKSHKKVMEYQFQRQKSTPTIFYVPHQDDDALAMALAIREHLDTGRKVIVHLYSDGINALLRDIVAGVVPCPIGHPPHRFNLTLQDVVTGRTHEFRQSLRALGVRDQDIHETGWSDIEPLKDYEAFQSKLRDLILGYEKKYPGASHKCISGEYDRDSVGRNPTHRACWDVATRLLNEHPKGWPDSRQLWDFRFYRTYTYYNPISHRSAQFIRALPQFLAFKQKALEQYKRWEPKRGELAWGYHSVKTLIDAAYNDPNVYMDMLDNDPTNPSNWYAPRTGGSSMFPVVWKPSQGQEHDWNQALIQAQVEAQVLPQGTIYDEEEDDYSDHDHGEEDGNFEDFVQEDEELFQEDIQEQEPPVAKWEKKEEEMKKVILESFEKAARGPEGVSYNSSALISKHS